MAKKPVISARNVWKIFGANPKKYLSQISADYSFEQIKEDGYIAGVKDVSIDVHKGEMLVIMGLSGSGKSTLVRCLSRLHDITGGTISVDNQDIMSLTEKELIELRRSKMGMVFQSFGLLPHRTVLENVAFPLEMRGQDKYTRRERALEVIKLVGLEGREEYFPRELSGGQQQRVGIARSLAIEPDIWFLDEPFSALDPLIRREMQDELLKIQEKLQKTMVFITHDFLEAIKMGDHIAIMKDGEVSQVGTPEEIVANPKDQYVKDFCEDVPKYKVLSASKVMREECCDDTKKMFESGSNNIPHNSKIETLIDKLVDTDQKFPVVNSETGELIGEIDRAIVMKSMKSAS